MTQPSWLSGRSSSLTPVSLHSHSPPALSAAEKNSGAACWPRHHATWVFTSRSNRKRWRSIDWHLWKLRQQSNQYVLNPQCHSVSLVPYFLIDGSILQFSLKQYERLDLNFANVSINHSIFLIQTLLESIFVVTLKLCDKGRTHENYIVIFKYTLSSCKCIQCNSNPVLLVQNVVT